MTYAPLLAALATDRQPALDDTAAREAWQQWFDAAATAHGRDDDESVPARVAALVGDRLRGPLTAAALHELDGPELWLAAACAAGQAWAIARFEADHLAGLDRALGHMKLDADRLAQVRQLVREKLLLPVDGASKLERYAGRGQLGALVRVVAVRAALDLLRTEDRAAEAPESAEAFGAMLDESASPELAAMRAEHTAAFKAAFTASVEALDPSDRGLLRLHVVDRLGIDAVAALHGVHRSTAARWLQGIRDRLGADIRRRLGDRLAQDRRGIESVIRAVDSQLDLSFSRLLGR